MWDPCTSARFSEMCKADRSLPYIGKVFVCETHASSSFVGKSRKIVGKSVLAEEEWLDR